MLPVPTPRIVRSAISIPTLDAPPTTPLPTANSTVDPINGNRQPKTLASWPNGGCGTDEATTNDLATHTYLCAPPISAVMEGKAVMIIAISRLKTKDKIHSATKVPQKRMGFLHSAMLAKK
jgi:hypothetical protein